VTSFSFNKSFSRAASHSCGETIGGEEIEALDVAAFKSPKLPMSSKDAAAQQFRYEGYDIITLEKLVERDYTIPEPQTAEEVISYYAKRIAQDVKLPSQFSVIVPKVRQFLEQRAFGRTVELNSPDVIRAISTSVAQYVTVKTFAETLRGLVVEELVPEVIDNGRPVSQTPPFPWSRPTFEAGKSVLRPVPCDNEFEKDFAAFLDGATDVQAFSKLPSQFNFSIEYTDSNGNLRYYEPDWVVRSDGGVHWLVETKGREDIDVAHKDKAATTWCEYATMLTDTEWHYVKVPQAEFGKLQASDFGEVALVFEKT
jgi:type III restriction enzyme